MNLVTEPASVTDRQHHEIREMVSRASGVIAHYWPMPTFVHHNPLHNLESLHFEEAVRLGQRFVGGHGYLPNEVFRDYFQTGRIAPQHLEAALRPVAQEEQVTLGAQTVSHFDVLRAHLLSGIAVPADESLSAFPECKVDQSSRRANCVRVEAVRSRSQSARQQSDTDGMVRPGPSHAVDRSDQSGSHQMVRSISGRRSRRLVHAGTRARFLPGLEIARAARMVPLRNSQ